MRGRRRISRRTLSRIVATAVLTPALLAACPSVGIAAPPAVTISAPSQLSELSIDLMGMVNPNSLATTCDFEYGHTMAFGNSTPCEIEPGAGGEFVNVRATVPWSESNGTTFFRLSAANADGVTRTEAVALIVHLHRPPTVTTLSGSMLQWPGQPPIGTLSLSGTVNPNGEPTTCEFQYGPTTAYGNAIPCASSPGAGSDPVVVSASADGLETSAAGYFRLVATNEGGTAVTPGSPIAFGHYDPFCDTTGLSAGCDQPPSGEVLVKPTAETGSPWETPALGEPTGVAAIARRATVKGRHVLLGISCVGSQGMVCRGSLRVVRRRFGDRRTATVVGKGRYAVAAGTKRSVRILLLPSGRRLLVRARHDIAVAVVGSQLRPRVVTVSN